MKGFLIAVAGLGVGGAAYYGYDTPDFDRTINRSPAAVYAAFSELAPEGSVTHDATDGMPRRMTVRTHKEADQSITYEVLLDDDPVLTAELAFAPAGDGGNATHMTAEFDIDAFKIGSLYQTQAGVALSLVPDRYFDDRFAEVMNDFADDIEAGRPLRPLDAETAGVRARRDSTDVDVRRAQARSAQRAAVRPMNDARPMVDPNAAADAYLHGRSNPNDYGRR